MIKKTYIFVFLLLLITASLQAATFEESDVLGEWLYMSWM